MVPKTDEHLLVAEAKWGGSPATRYAGRAMSPPPPATASTSPAKNTSGQTMRNILSVTSIKKPPNRKISLSTPGEMW